MQTIKPYKLLIIAIVVCSNVFSQTNVYKPFTQGFGFWSMTEQSINGLNYYQYKTSGDSLIGSYTYKKVLYSVSLHNPFNFGSYTFLFGYRNDSINKKVYYLDVTNGVNSDLLWYDFNLAIGDTVKSTYSYMKNVFPNNRVVQSIDSVLICGSYYKRFHFNCIDDAADLVEGIGFMDNFIHTGRGNDCPFEPYVVYTTGFSTCYFTSVKDYSKDYQVKLYPNPASSELKINSSVQIHEYTILNNIGTVVLKGNLLDVQSINVSSLSTGLYIIKLQDKSGKSYQSKFIKE